MPNIATWLSQLNQLNANPGDIQALALQQLQDTLAGTTDVTNPTNPFIFLMEAAAVESAAAMQSYEAYTRLQYGAMAQTPDQLYVQMSDVDYLNRFAIPSTGTFYLLLQYDELIAAMMPTGVNNISKIRIPRYTAVTVNGITFTAQYPIDIIQMSQGGLQITYDNSELSPVQQLETNIVPWQMVTLNDLAGQTGPTTYVSIQITLQQFAIQTQTGKVGVATGFVQTYPYPDQFYYARAFTIDAQGNSTEILTTHTDQVFDPATPTLLLKDLGGSLEVELPIIYITNASINGDIEIDIYTTQGVLTLDLSQYPPNSFTIAWNGETSTDSKYVAPLSTISTMSIYASGASAITNGGSDGMTFAELRSQVLENNYGAINLPITPSQISNKVAQLGYSSVIDVDMVTDRIITATRSLPAPTNGVTSAGAAITIQTLVSSTNELVEASTVINNGSRITLLPSTLYRLINGQLSICPDALLQQLKSLPMDSLANALNAATYLYTPFHYVLDSNNNMFELRPYYLNNPAVNSAQFVAANESAGITVGTADKEIVPTSTGYRLRIQCQSSQSWKNIPDSQVFCQIAYIPEGETNYAYMNGTLIGSQPLVGSTTGANERIFEFDITTNYDADSNDNLYLTSFQMYNDTPRPHGVPLTSNYMVFWVAEGIINSSISTTEIDQLMGVDLLPPQSLGIAQEEYSIVLGVALDTGLWHRSRSIAGSGLNQVYSANVYQTYTKVVYVTDSSGNYVLNTDGNGNVTFQILHNIGDPVLDSNGNQVILHRTGDPVLDNAGNPIPISVGTLQRECDLFLVEGVYYFVTGQDASAYAATIAPTIANWVQTDLATLNQSLLEMTSIYFYPQITIGDIEVLVGGGVIQTIPSTQQFSITVELDSPTYSDLALRQPLEEQITTTLASQLQQKTVSLYQIQNTLGAILGSGVIGVTISGLGGALNLHTVTMLDDATRLSIAHQAVVDADGRLGVADAISIIFLQHDISASLSTIQTQTTPTS